MKSQLNRPLLANKIEVKTASLRTRLGALRQELLTLDWLTEGSVTEGSSGSWRWTRKVKAKTVTVALSDEQAEAFRAAILNHRRLEKLILEMRQISQTYLLECLPNPPRRRSRKSAPNQS
jgi:hypothetical protein